MSLDHHTPDLILHFFTKSAGKWLMGLFVSAFCTQLVLGLNGSDPKQTAGAQAPQVKEKACLESDLKCTQNQIWQEIKETSVWQEYTLQKQQKQESSKDAEKEQSGSKQTSKNTSDSALDSDLQIKPGKEQVLDYHQKVYLLLQILPPEDQQKLCKQNLNFTAQTQIEAKIHATCQKVAPRAQQVQGLNNEKEGEKDLQEIFYIYEFAKLEGKEKK